MKNIILLPAFLLIVAFSNLVAQEQDSNIVLDTIYASDHKNVALFFPDPIRQGIAGSENFVFTYNKEKQQHLGLLQATPGKESNLLVISNSGAVFSYIVKYAEQPGKLNYFILDSSAIGKEDPGLLQKKKETEGNFSEKNAEETFAADEVYYSNFSSYLLNSKQRIGRIKKRKEGVVLNVKNIVFNKEELYFEMEIDNGSSVDYELNFLNISVETRKRGKKKSMQNLVLEPLLLYGVPVKIARGEKESFVYVLPKFSIAADKVVVIHLKEKNGERDIKLKIRKKIINNPN